MKRTIFAAAILLGSISSATYAVDNSAEPAEAVDNSAEPAEAVKHPIEELMMKKSQILRAKLQNIENETEELDQEFEKNCKTKDDLAKDPCKKTQIKMIDVTLSVAKLFKEAVDDGVKDLNAMKQKLQ